MSYLARCNFVHRDVAARNVLVGLGKCKISDFGLAAHGTSHMSGSVVPLRWAAPESLQSRVWSEKSDVWSFGCLMYECVTGGVLPYVGLTDNAVYRVSRTKHAWYQACMGRWWWSGGGSASPCHRCACPSSPPLTVGE